MGTQRWFDAPLVRGEFATPLNKHSQVLDKPHLSRDEPSNFDENCIARILPARLPRPLSGLGGLQTTGVEMSGHGYAAMTLGIITLLVGCGLMALMFYSSRCGYDERVSDLSDSDNNHAKP